MRKTIFIVGLIALLLFVFPVVASANPPSSDEGDDAWTILQNEFIEQVISWLTELQSSNWPETIHDAAHANLEASRLQDEYLAARLNAIWQALRANMLHD